MTVDIPLFQPLIDGMNLSFGSPGIAIVLMAICCLATLLLISMESSLALIFAGSLFLMMGWAGYATYGVLGVVVVLMGYIVTFALYRALVK